MVLLTLPYDRAANGYLPRIASIPIRPQDLAILMGFGLSIPAIRFRRPQAGNSGWLIVAFLAIGLAATLGGLVGGNDVRDILRDARWWFLYGSGLVLFFLPVSTRAQVIRGVLFGALGFAVVAIAASILPAVPGGLRAHAEEFDFGLLRMQYGNSAFLLLPIARGVFEWLRGRNVAIAPVVIASLAVMLSLTRTLMVVLVVVVLLTGLAILVEGARGRPTHRSLPWARMSVVVATMPLVLVLALAINTGMASPTAAVGPEESVPSTASPGSSAPTTPSPSPIAEDPFGRITFGNDSSGWGSITGGRLKTYRRALDVIVANPLGGSGMGATVVADYAFGGEPFATPGRLPNVDDAYLTVGMKGGLPAMVILGLLLALPALWGLCFVRGRVTRIWWLPSWLGILALTVTQSFATTGYSPFLLGLLVVVFARGYTLKSARPTRARA